MSPPIHTDLFEAAGLAPPGAPAGQPKRQRKPPPPTPAERAASGRLGGARRSRPPQRHRVGPPRDLAQARVLSFPFSRNARLLADAIEKLPHGYDDKLDVKCGREARNLEKRLVHQGIPKQSARVCATELLLAAYTKRVTDAHKEAGVL